MMSIEESATAVEASKNLNTGTTFIGYGTKQIIQNNGWSTVRNLTKMVDRTESLGQLSALKPATLHYFPKEKGGISMAVPMSVSPAGDSSEVGFAGVIFVENRKEVPAKSLSNVSSCDELTSETPASSSLDSSLAVVTATSVKDVLASDDWSTIRTRGLVNDKTNEASLIKQAVGSSDSELFEIQNEIKDESENESENSKDHDLLEVDASLLENNNCKDIITLENVKTDKAAARLQLNAVLQSEISKTVKAKLIDVAKSSAETRLSNFLGGQTARNAINLSSLPVDRAEQNPTGSKTNLSQVVRIQNAKIVEVFQTENQVLTPAAPVPRQASSFGGFVAVNGNMIPSKYSKENESTVTLGHFETAKDIFKCPRPPHMIFSSLQCNNVVEAKTDCSIVHPQDFDLLDRGDDGKSFVFDPLCISADTLVPVAGIPGHGEQQNPVKDNNVCLQQNDGNKNSGWADTSNESESTTLRCFLCPFFHTKQSKIAKHWIDTHLRQLPYICSYCDKGFTTSWEVQKHVVKFHPGKKLKVGIKNSTHFASSLAYEVVQSDVIDVETSTDVETVVPACRDLQVCKKCDFQCETSAELRSHQRSFHYKFKPYFCTYCSDRKASFVCDFDLKQHIRVYHPERMPTMGRPFPEAVVPKLTADINWSSTYETISVANQVIFQCRSCAFRSQLSESAWKHVLLNHNWPEIISCPSCASTFELSSADRERFSTSCPRCKAVVYLGPDAANVKPNDKGEPVYICTICDYKTMGKGSMNRHLKYNHTKCRPYGCVYCNYVAVERPKVKMHIESLHKGQKIAIKERTESSEGFRKLVEDLFGSIVRIGYYSELSDNVGAVAADDLNAENEIDGDDAGTRSRKRKRLSAALDDDTDVTMYPASPFEVDVELAAQARERDRKSINGEHFKCMICGYVCTDRSCMSRHIKYMHITSRPHSCPYCRYNNVEKTKVRLHVKSHHPNQPKCVKTNKKLLEDMSSEAKKFYIKVDSSGRVMKSSSSACLLPRASSDIDQDQESVDSMMNEFILTELDPETDMIDVQTDLDGATVVLKEGVYQVGIKEEPNDDVEIKEEPGVHLSKLNDLTLSSSALDHNYVIDMPDAALPPASDLNVRVKTEPEDCGYELGDDKLSPAEIGSGVKKAFVDFSSEPSDEDDDEDEDQSLVDIPLGASASSLDGLEGLDSDEDDLDEDSDLDFIDFADFELNGSSLLNFDVVAKSWKSSEHQVEQNRIQLLHQIQMDDDVREDPKIWMWTVVKVEDIISRISANKPIMDI